MRHLVFREYVAGFNNRLMSLEVAVGLAHCTGRRLVFHGGEKSCYAPAELARHDGATVPTLLDLLEEIPVPHLSIDAFRSLGARSAREVVRREHRALHECVFCPLGVSDRDPDLVAFAEGRDILRDPDEPTWDLHGANLTFYSRFFYRPDRGLHEVLQRVRPRAEYRQLAARAIESLGAFDAVHLRLTDFRQAHPRHRLSLRRMRKSLAAVLGRARPVLVCTDEPGNTDFLEALFQDVPSWSLVDDLFVGAGGRFRSDFEALPYHDHVTLGLVCNLVTAGAVDFVGTAGSTYSGLIHRGWLRRHVDAGAAREDLPFCFLESGLPWPHSVRAAVGIALGRAPRRIFARGRYLDTRAGAYSWNRTHMPLPTGAKSWWREWPESVGLDDTAARGRSERP